MRGAAVVPPQDHAVHVSAAPRSAPPRPIIEDVAETYGSDKAAEQTANTIKHAQTARERFQRTAKEKQRSDGFDGKKPSDGNYSTRAQWSERVARPVAARPMTMEQVTDFQAVLSICEQVDDPSHIPWKMQRITDYNDEDRNDCLELLYFGERVGEKGHRNMRPIWRMKLPMPRDLRDAAEKQLRESFCMPPAPRRRKVYITDRSTAEKYDTVEKNAASVDIVSMIDYDIEMRQDEILQAKDRNNVVDEDNGNDDDNDNDDDDDEDNDDEDNSDDDDEDNSDNECINGYVLAGDDIEEYIDD